MTQKRKALKPKIFSGKHSEELWDDINDATTIDKLRWAIYHLACHCQEYEDRYRRNRRAGSRRKP